jgi:hypothetical protein
MKDSLICAFPAECKLFVSHGLLVNIQACSRTRSNNSIFGGDLSAYDYSTGWVCLNHGVSMLFVFCMNFLLLLLNLLNVLVCVLAVLAKHSSSLLSCRTM